MMRLIVEDDQFVNVAHDHAQVHLGVGGRPGRSLARGNNPSCFRHPRSGLVVIAGIDPMNVRKEDIPRLDGMRTSS